MHIRKFVVSPVQSNCYVVSESQERGAQAVIIDPGDIHLDAVFSYIEDEGLRLVANWNTHAHFDHVAGANLVRSKYGISAWLHPDDLVVWDAVPASVLRFTGETVAPLLPPEQELRDGMELRLGDLTFQVMSTPGHSPGSVILYDETVAFTGDTLFAGTIGRTDLPHSSSQQMEASLQKLWSLPESLRCYPGHMGETTLASERQSNPFLLAHRPR
ncbi:MAG: MBL fold metallo-hydrolase [Alicyclobacillaceae bacterium]|nr:MBL fold metallo-hydrolase [Alicyclobacillaceae bacterium]